MIIKEIETIHNELNKLDAIATVIDVAPQLTARQKTIIRHVQNVRRLLKQLLPNISHLYAP